MMSVQKRKSQHHTRWIEYLFPDQGERKLFEEKKKHILGVSAKRDIGRPLLSISGVLDISLPELVERPRLFAPIFELSPIIAPIYPKMHFTFFRESAKGQYELQTIITIRVSPIDEEIFFPKKKMNIEMVERYMFSKETIATFQEKSYNGAFKNVLANIGWLRFQDVIRVHGENDEGTTELICTTVQNAVKYQLEANHLIPGYKNHHNTVMQMLCTTNESPMLLGNVQYNRSNSPIPNSNDCIEQIVRAEVHHMAMRRVFY